MASRNVLRTLGVLCVFAASACGPVSGILSTTGGDASVSASQRRSVLSGTVGACGTGGATPSTGGVVIYGDALMNGFQDWSWATHSLTETNVVHGGLRSISFEADGWNGLYFHGAAARNVADYDGLDLWVNGGTTGGQRLDVVLVRNDQPLGRAPLGRFLPGGGPAKGCWSFAHVPFSALGVSSGTFDSIWIQDASGGTQATVYLDDLRLVPAGGTSGGAADGGTTGGTTGGIADGGIAGGGTTGGTGGGTAGSGATLIVYDDALENGFADWSWATRDLAETTVVHGGQAAISFSPSGWAGLYFHRDAGFDVTTYPVLDLWVNGGTTGGQLVDVVAVKNASAVGRAPLASFVPGGRIPAGTWVEVAIPFADLGVPSGTLTGLWLQAATGGTQGDLYVDDVVLGPGSATTGGTTDGGTVGGTTGGGTVGGTTDGGTVGGTPDAGTTGGTPDAGTTGGTPDAGTTGGATDGGATGAGTDGGTTGGGTDGGTTGGGPPDAGTPPPPPTADVTVHVDTAANVHPVSPLVYGVNFGTAAEMASMHYPLRRWGGNQMSTYNWQADVANTGSDWFFINEAQSGSNGLSSADTFIDDTRADGGKALMTFPIIGWTPKDAVKRWSFSVAKYGAQQQTECTASGNASWCSSDAGNGTLANGTKITNNDPTDTMMQVGPSFEVQWLQHIESRVGSAANGGVEYYDLDNEPMLWPDTHQDVHPNPTTFDELWSRTVSYASALKAADPNIKLLGPAVWGWCAYFGSSGECGGGPDQTAHGGLPFLAWYLQQDCAYQKAHGVRLVDDLDVHYYPQASGVALSSDESAATSALRLRSIKSLYDPSYVDESWIGQAVDLIPRLKQWIAQYCPGTGIAITEYNFGNDTGASSALAEAEVLAVFGREGVDLATRWTAPAAGSAVEDAFRLYLDYDGAGDRVTGDSVQATSSSVDQVASYAIQGTGTLYVLLFNHDTSPHAAYVTVAGGLTGTAHLYGFDGSQALGPMGTVAADGAGMLVSLPPRSAVLAVIPH